MDNYLPHEIKHLDDLRKISSECTLFLARDNSFPLKDLKEVSLFGNGVRHTVKGGTGSGDVNIREFINIEQAFINKGIKVLTTDYLDAFDAFTRSRKKEFIKEVKKEAKEIGISPMIHSVGSLMKEKDYDIDISSYDSEVAIYVLTRNAGEGQDRKAIPGDYLLTNTEINIIKYLNKKFKKFLLVLNVSSVVDISPILEVKNILLLSQLGSLTSETLVDIVLGNKYPSGKLSTSWAKYEDYPSAKNFGDINDANYEEGIYVGYRYFDAKGLTPLFPFGYGLSYTEFDFKLDKIEQNNDQINTYVKVSNIGKFPGKEVIQLYLRKPSKNIVNPPQILVNFAKTKELLPGESEILSISFSFKDFPTFSIETSSYLLEAGYYYLYMGNSSRKNEEIASIENKEDIILKKVNNPHVKLTFDELQIPLENKEHKNSNHFVLDKTFFAFEEVRYSPYKVEIDPFVASLSDEELMHLAIGDVKSGLSTVVGNACTSVCGGAGETTLKIKNLKYSLSMCDGPAGLRLCKEYMVSKGKNYPIFLEPLWQELANYLPFIIKPILNREKNRKRKGKIHFQFATSIPVATALAQSFSREVVSVGGDIVREEMEIYNCDLWLAPAMNIHRNPLCGRNFEYYSEDPLLTAVCASAMVNSIQKNPTKGAVIKHFLCNNQETNRTNNSSNISNRAMREIYLFAFAKTIKEANPAAIMSSYNLINGLHMSENYYVQNDILRCELDYKGLVMTDWIYTKQIYNKKSVYPCTYASKNINGGVNLCMPGGNSDLKDLKKALKNGTLNRGTLLNNDSIVYSLIKKLKNINLD